MSNHVVASLLLLAGCSLAKYENVDCEDNAECQEAFGYGSVCGEEGFCGVAERHPRCQASLPDSLTLPVDPDTTLLVGSVFDHASDADVSRYRSAQLSFDQANSNGGLNGAEFAVLHCSNESDEDNNRFDGLDKVDASVEVAIWLSEVMGVPAIVGPAASSHTEAVFNAVADTYGTLVMSPSATSPSLTPLDGLTSTNADPGLLWRTAPPDSLQGAVIAADMSTEFDPSGANNFRTSPSTDVAVIFQTGAYGDGLEAVFTDELIAAGGQSTGFPFGDESTRAEAIANVASGSFDEVLFISSESSDVVAFLLGAGALRGYDDMPIFLTDGGRNGDVLSEAASARALFPQVRGTGPANPSGPVYDAFAVSYAAEYSGEDASIHSFTAQSYDAGWLLAYGHVWALAQEDGVSGLSIARGLRRLSQGVELDIRPTNWNQVKASFEAGTTVDINGTSGPLDFDPSSGETTASIELWTISDSGTEFNLEYAVSP